MENTASPSVCPTAPKAVPQAVSIPFLGTVAIADLSLPVLTIVLGALDGFNPCAMWVLVFLIGLLVGMQDRVRMWTLGTAFIAGSALVKCGADVAALGNLVTALKGATALSED